MKTIDRIKMRRRGLGTVGLLWLVCCLTGAGLLWEKALSLEAPHSVQQHVKRIEDVKVGDYVLAKDPADSGPPTPHRVVALPRNWTEHVVHMRVQGGGELQATRMHPFWVDGNGWTNAKDLKFGD